MVEEVFQGLPYCKRLEKVAYGYIIETNSGVVETYQLSKFIYNPMIRSFLEQNVFIGNCHEAAEMCSPFFPNFEITTSELTPLFDGLYYHSYLQCKDEVLDLAANTIYTNNTFNSFYEPKELQRISSNELDKYIQTLPNEEERRCKILRLAIQNKIRMEEQ